MTVAKRPRQRQGFLEMNRGLRVLAPIRMDEAQSFPRQLFRETIARAARIAQRACEQFSSSFRRAGSQAGQRQISQYVPLQRRVAQLPCRCAPRWADQAGERPRV